MLDKWKRVGQSWFDLKSELALQWSVKMEALDPWIVIKRNDITKKESLSVGNIESNKFILSSYKDVNNYACH